MKRPALAALLLLAAGAPDNRAAALLDALKAAQSAEQAQQLEAQITAAWRAQITPAVQLLVTHALQAMQRGDQKTAIGDLDAALDLQADQPDLWRLHAEARFAAGDDRGATADLAQALSREPRCFTALADLSRFAESRNDYPRALEAWQRLLEIDPKVKQGEARLEKLQRKLSGQQL
jgi:tetratricopeptide (TPR) repeat protein